MIILDQDLFSIEVILSISATLRPLTTSDEDVLRIGLRRKLDCLRRRHLRMTYALHLGMSERRDLFG